MPVVDLAGVLVHTSHDRFAVMREFYVGVLELVPRSDRPGFVNFEFGNQRLTIATHNAVSGVSTDPERVMINFAVNGIEALWDHIVAAGAPEIRPPSGEPWGGLVATTADPDGNFVQLLQFDGDTDTP